MDNHKLNNILILCTKDNKDQLSAFLRDHKVTDTMTIVSADLTADFYYGLNNNRFAHSDKKFVDNFSTEIELSCRYITLQQALDEFGPVHIEEDVTDRVVRSFPRIMWVKMDNLSSVWKKAMVIAFNRDKYITWANYNNLETLSDPVHITHEAFETDWFDMALEEDEIKAVTREEIANMLNVTIDKLLIL